MILNTIDQIVRRLLLENNLPIHFYSEYLFHGASCIRELSFDTLKIINTINLPVDDIGAANLPDDYVDEVAVSLRAGLLLQQIPHRDDINPLRVHSTTTGEFVRQPEQGLQNVDINNTTYFGSYSWSWFWNVDSLGEFTGRFFGANGGTQTGYKIIKERRQIQLSDGIAGGNIILQYISDGQSLDNASQITPQATSCIQAYINWKSGQNRAIKDSLEASTFYNEKRLLRARLSEMNLIDIKNVLRSNYTAAYKT